MDPSWLKAVFVSALCLAYRTELMCHLCSVNGTHYCDITGETDWVRKMIDQYDEVARVSGSRIVHFCGHDCIPWDILSKFLILFVGVLH